MCPGMARRIGSARLLTETRPIGVRCCSSMDFWDEIPARRREQTVHKSVTYESERARWRKIVPYA